ncbi:cell cycle regulator of non-homologous end joining [Passer montanus]|uniref:cell cycle regulator of non-homologous end joining n=1 Tax=Passer montanus TaxID=9160 RepID=UPI0019601415|nr:cell cycle regulator of non-homologous end joining [Passer montanus]
MNEAELVEVALAVLAENLQCEEGEENARSRSEEEQEIPPTPKEVPGSTANTDGGSDHGPALPSPPGAGADAKRTGREDSEDDVLKYVREIFFS